MNGDRGASLPVHVAFGASPYSTSVPGDGNGWATRFREDLELFAELGVGHLRLGLDWSRLQPVEGSIDHDTREWYQQFLIAARDAGIDVWLSLQERGVPRWFDDLGGFGDDKATARYWPRYVDASAELFGDLVAGWFPIHDPIGLALAAADGVSGSPRHLDALANLLTAWRDTWRILGGGEPRVATSLGVRTIRPIDDTVPAKRAAQLEDSLRYGLWLRALRDGVVAIPSRTERRVADLAGSLDVLGIALGTDIGAESDPTDAALGAWRERAGALLRRVAEQGPSVPMAVIYRARLQDDDDRRHVIEVFGDAVASARADGVPIERVFWEPGLDGVADATGPIDRDRAPKPSAAAWPV